MFPDDMKKRAESAKEKQAQYGDDIDLDKYDYTSSEPREIESIDDVSSEDRSLVKEVGFDTSQQSVSASFIQFDAESILADVLLSQEGLEVLPMGQALKQYDWLQEYLWKAVPVDVDKYTARSELEAYNGYFIRAKAGAKIGMPVQSCLIMKKSQAVQNVHNIIIAEEGSELHIINGCATPSEVDQSLHLGVTEFYVRKNAQLSFTMVHRWSEKTDVRPRSAAIV
ncbi:MAG: SufD family Fe-S cluster assembly protein, partial [Candidatus Thorarchaeota archaeon]